MDAMTIKLSYFMRSGKCIGDGYFITTDPDLLSILGYVMMRIELDRLPGLRSGSADGLTILLDTSAHPDGDLRLIYPR